MLNEYIEYREYMQWPVLAPRILTHKNYAMTDKKLSGIERPLTVIARKILFDDLGYDELMNEESRADAIKKTVDALKAWLAFEEAPNVSDSIKDFQTEWFKSFFQEKFGNDAWSDLVLKKQSQFGESLLPQKNYSLGEKDSQANTYKLITYERIVADAIYQGPLQKKYLVCKIGFESDIVYHVYRSENKKTFLDHTESLKKSAKGIKSNCSEKLLYSDLLLRFIAAYLMERNRCGQKNVILNKTDLYNWIQSIVPFKGDKTKFLYSSFEYNPRNNLDDTEYLFASEAYDNVSKSRVNQNYLRKYGFMVLDDVSDLPDGYTFFSDQGSGRPLANLVLYK